VLNAARYRLILVATCRNRKMVTTIKMMIWLKTQIHILTQL